MMKQIENASFTRCMGWIMLIVGGITLVSGIVVTAKYVNEYDAKLYGLLLVGGWYLLSGLGAFVTAAVLFALDDIVHHLDQKKDNK